MKYSNEILSFLGFILVFTQTGLATLIGLPEGSEGKKVYFVWKLFLEKLFLIFKNQKLPLFFF